MQSKTILKLIPLVICSLMFISCNKDIKEKSELTNDLNIINSLESENVDSPDNIDIIDENVNSQKDSKVELKTNEDLSINLDQVANDLDQVVKEIDDISSIDLPTLEWNINKNEEGFTWRKNF